MFTKNYHILLPYTVRYCTSMGLFSTGVVVGYSRGGGIDNANSITHTHTSGQTYSSSRSYSTVHIQVYKYRSCGAQDMWYIGLLHVLYCPSSSPSTSRDLNLSTVQSTALWLPIRLPPSRPVVENLDSNVDPYRTAYSTLMPSTSTAQVLYHFHRLCTICVRTINALPHLEPYFAGFDVGLLTGTTSWTPNTCTVVDVL